jgi:hypothetical protein
MLPIISSFSLIQILAAVHVQLNILNNLILNVKNVRQVMEIGTIQLAQLLFLVV